MRSVHKIVGVVVVIVFLFTGQYMEYRYHGWAGVDDAVRMMYRSRHIYVLMAGLVNIALGLNFTWRIKPWRKAFQKIGSALILVAPFALIAGFFYEPMEGVLQRQFTAPAIVAIFAGTLLHLIASARQGKEMALSEQSELNKSSAATVS